MKNLIIRYLIGENKGNRGRKKEEREEIVGRVIIGIILVMGRRIVRIIRIVVMSQVLRQEMIKLSGLNKI